MLNDNDVIHMQAETMFGGIPTDMYEYGEYTLLLALSFVFYNFEHPYSVALSLIRDYLSSKTPEQICETLSDFPDTHPDYEAAQYFVRSAKSQQKEFILGLLSRLEK